ncbi:hypothetical protein KAS50_07850, partial [bacterium]|nr:hypothetical protein [bacterium]
MVYSSKNTVSRVRAVRELFKTKQCPLFLTISLVILLSLMAGVPFSAYGQTKSDFMPESFGITSLKEPWKRENISLEDKICYYFTRNPAQNQSFSRKIEVDLLTHKFLIKEQVFGGNVSVPQVFDIDGLLYKRISMANREMLFKDFRENAQELFKDTGDGFRRTGVGFTVPMPMDSRLIQTLIGSDINLKVTGSVSIDGKMIQRTQNLVKTNVNQSSDYTFQLNQMQKFNIRGNIGKLVNVNIDQDSQREFDYMNNLNLNYKGKEDDIVTEFQAGNIALSLPGTRFVTFSASNSGLFGIKSGVKTGPLKVTTIASLERGNKQKLSLQGGAQSRSMIIKDYSYVKGVYFFVDKSY